VVICTSNGGGRGVGRVIAILVLAAMLQGCSGTPRARVANPVTLPCDVDEVWLAGQADLKGRGFALEKVDRRHGIIETLPRTSSQWYEFWARDVVTAEGRAEASLHTIRRFVRLELSVGGADRCDLGCCAQVERFVAGSAAMSGSVRANSVLGSVAGRMPGLKDDRRRRGGQWVSLGRDAALEQDVLQSIRRAVIDRNMHR